MDAPTPKPCPDCGHDAEHHHLDAGNYVFCGNDQCRSRPCTSAHPSVEAAITAWNNDLTT